MCLLHLTYRCTQVTHYNNPKVLAEVRPITCVSRVACLLSLLAGVTRPWCADGWSYHVRQALCFVRLLLD